MKLDQVGELINWDQLEYNTFSKKNNPKMANWPESVRITKRLIVHHEEPDLSEKKKGVNALDIEEGQFNLSIALDRGMEPHTLRYGENRISWETPIGQLLHPDDVNLAKAGRILNAPEETLAEGIGGALEAFENFTWIAAPRFGGPIKEKGPGYDTLHGTASFSIAEHVNVGLFYDGADFYIRIRGVTKPAGFRFEHDILKKVGKNSYVHRVTVTNTDNKNREFEFAFHNQFKPGQIYLPTSVVFPRDIGYGNDKLNKWNTYGEFENRVPDMEECYFHRLARVPGLEEIAALEGDNLTAALVMQNDSFGALHIFDMATLQAYTEWRYFAKWFINRPKEVRVFGSEPSDRNHPDENNPRIMKPRDKVTYQQEVLVVNSQEQAARLIEMIYAATKGEQPWLVYDSRRNMVNRQELLKFGG